MNLGQSPAVGFSSLYQSEISGLEEAFVVYLQDLATCVCVREVFPFKGTAHPKMILHPFITHHFVDIFFFLKNKSKQNMALTSAFQDKLDCRIFRTPGGPHRSGMFFLLFFCSMLSLYSSTGWNSLCLRIAFFTHGVAQWAFKGYSIFLLPSAAKCSCSILQFAQSGGAEFI